MFSKYLSHRDRQSPVSVRFQIRHLCPLSLLLCVWREERWLYCLFSQAPPLGSLRASKRTLNLRSFWKLRKLWFLYLHIRYGLSISQWSMAGYQLAAGLPESSLHTSMLCAQCQCRQREILGDVYLYCTFLLEGVWPSHGDVFAMAEEF